MSGRRLLGGEIQAEALPPFQVGRRKKRKAGGNGPERAAGKAVGKIDR